MTRDKKRPEAEAGGPTAAPRLAVLFPTTAELICVRGLVQRPRLPRSHVVTAGDFRSLAISGDFHQLVGGPLQSLVSLSNAVELRLSGDIDRGRSWELPVTLAHAAAAADCLVDDAAEADVVAWATGALDSELRVVDDDYEIARKIEVSESELRRIATAGKDIRILLPHSTSRRDFEGLSRALADLHVRIVRVASLPEALRELGIPTGASPPDFRTNAAGPTEAIRPKGTRTVGLVLVSVALFAAIAFSLSTLRNERRNEGTAAAVVQVLELHAADRAACIAAIMAGEPLASRPPVRSEDGGLLAVGGEGLCGLRVGNSGRQPVHVQLDNALQPHAMAGGSPLFQGLDLDSGRHIDLLFAQRPAGVKTVLTVRDRSGVAALPLRLEEAG